MSPTHDVGLPESHPVHCLIRQRGRLLDGMLLTERAYQSAKSTVATQRAMYEKYCQQLKEVDVSISKLLEGVTVGEDHNGRE